MTLERQYKSLPKLMNVAQVAEFTFTHERTVRRWIKGGRLRAAETPEGIRVHRKALWSFLGLDMGMSA